jgi:hypothetical protein
MRFVIAPCKRLIERQLGLHPLKLLLTDEGRDGCERDPQLPRQDRGRRRGFADRMGGRTPQAGRL